MHRSVVNKGGSNAVGDATCMVNKGGNNVVGDATCYGMVCSLCAQYVYKMNILLTRKAISFFTTLMFSLDTTCL